MAHQVMWTKSIVDAFVDEAMLSEDEEFIIRTRAKSWTVSKQAMYLNVSESTVHSMIKNLKKKYDQAQKNRPDELPPRTFSTEEVYMDHH